MRTGRGRPPPSRARQAGGPLPLCRSKQHSPPPSSASRSVACRSKGSSGRSESSAAASLRIARARSRTRSSSDCGAATTTRSGRRRCGDCCIRRPRGHRRCYRWTCRTSTWRTAVRPCAARVATLLPRRFGWLDAASPASSAITHLAEGNVGLALLIAKSRHSSLRSLQRYARPGAEAVAALTAAHDPDRRRPSA
jgi:hypothetical protein